MVKLLSFDAEASMAGAVRTFSLVKAEIGEKGLKIHESWKWIIPEQYDEQTVLTEGRQANKFMCEMFHDYPVTHEFKMSFSDSIRELWKILKRHTAHVFVSFCLDNDMANLFKTDRVQSEKFFTRDPLTYPEDVPIPMVCAYRLLGARCPNTNALIRDSGRRLEHYLQALFGPGRIQTHYPTRDTIDLLDVLQKAWHLDRFDVPKTTYLPLQRSQTKTT